MINVDTSKEQLIVELELLRRRMAELEERDAEHRQAEEKIKHAAEEWRTTFDSITDLVSIQDKDFRLVRVNKAFANAFKMKPAELIGKPCYEIVHGTSEPVPNCPHKQTLEAKEPSMGEFFEPHLGIHLQVTTSPIFNEKGEVVGSVHIARDITERKRAEAALRESEEKLRLMFQSVTEGITVSDLEGEIVQVNEAVVHLHGYDNKEELIGCSALDFIAEKDHARAMENLKKTLEEGYSGTIEYTFLTRDGREFPAELSAAVLKDASGNPTGFIAITRDITEHKEMEQQLILTDRLASVGELASGIAHELNNPLTGVIGFSQLLLDKKDVSDDVKLDLKIIYSEAQRAAQVVKGLLTFARKHAPVKQPVNIDSIIEKVLELRTYEQRVNNIQVNTHFVPDLPEVMADHFQLQQVFLNIIINAEYFMIEAHHEGTLTITTERVGDIIRASFTDDGPGISQENLGHLFDPFFTTKEVGKGTGLGLSICHGVITEHGGRIYAESELGKGATFVVELPISDH